MSEQSGELSEGDRLGPGGIVDEGDPTPYAEDANQVADGAPKNYGAENEDLNLVREEAEGEEPIRGFEE